VQSQARLCLFGIAQLHSLTRDTIRRPGGEESFSGHATFFTTFCIRLAEISAVLVLDDLPNMSFETYMGLTQFPHANAKILGVEPIY
jgi:hypothetical protein